MGNSERSGKGNSKTENAQYDFVSTTKASPTLSREQTRARKGIFLLAKVKVFSIGILSSTSALARRDVGRDSEPLSLPRIKLKG